MTNKNTEKMRTVLTEMLKARYNPPSVAGANADDIITRFEVEGLLSKFKGVETGDLFLEEIKGHFARDYSDGISIKDEDGVLWITKDGKWTK